MKSDGLDTEFTSWTMGIEFSLWTLHIDHKYLMGKACNKHQDMNHNVGRDTTDVEV